MLGNYLPPRLQVIADVLLDKDWVGFADIGTDHGILPCKLVNELGVGRGPFIATDIREGPLMHAKARIESMGLNSSIEVRLGPGMSPLKAEEVEVAVIAGMGPRTISEILIDDVNQELRVMGGVKWIVIQANGLDDVMRKWLHRSMFSWCEQRLVVEGCNNNCKRYIVDVLVPPLTLSSRCNRPERHTMCQVIETLATNGIDDWTAYAFGPLLLFQKCLELQPWLLETIIRMKKDAGKAAGAGRDDQAELYMKRIVGMEAALSWLSR